MAIWESLDLQNRSTACSTQTLSPTDNDFARHVIGVGCSPFDLPLPSPSRSYQVSPRHVSKLKLRPTPCDLNGATYQNGQITPTSPLVSLVKADKTPFPPPIANAWTWSPENTSSLASLPPTRSDEGPSNWYGSTLHDPKELLQWQRHHSVRNKPLLSPIKFDEDVEARSTNQNGELPHPDTFLDEEIDEAVYEDTNSFHSSDWDLTAPSRRLSYGEPLDMIEARCTRRSTVSADLPSRVKTLMEDKRCDMWIDDTLKAQANRPYNSEPTRRKPRLWLDLVRDDEEITEAHATAVTSSPSKPRMISIGPRRFDTEPCHDEQQSPAVSNFQCGMSTYLPETPPQSPTLNVATPQMLPTPPRGRSTEISDTAKYVRQDHVFDRIQSRTTWSTATPSHADASLWGSETIRKDAPRSPSIPTTPSIQRQPTPPPTSIRSDIKLSELTTWMITELEISLSSKPPTPLELTHPVILQLRLPPKQRKAPRPTPLIPARSSFSFSASQGPLSSHTSPSSFADAPRKSSTWPFSDPALPTADPTLSLLTRIFPHAHLPTLSTLLAAILAHHFLSTLHIPPSSSSSTTSLFPPRHSTTDNLPTHIPSKARAMLGLPPSNSPGKPKDGRPPLPSFWRRMERVEWRERVAGLEKGLRRAVGEGVRELVGGEEWGEDRWVEVVVRAVGEVVKLGEEGRIGGGGEK